MSSPPAKKVKVEKSKEREAKRWAQESAAAGLGGLTISEAARGALYHPAVREELDKTDYFVAVSINCC